MKRSMLAICAALSLAGTARAQFVEAPFESPFELPEPPEQEYRTGEVEPENDFLKVQQEGIERYERDRKEMEDWADHVENMNAVLQRIAKEQESPVYIPDINAELERMMNDPCRTQDCIQQAR